jgi:hypothetical protein
MEESLAQVKDPDLRANITLIANALAGRIRDYGRHAFATGEHEAGTEAKRCRAHHIAKLLVDGLLPFLSSDEPKEESASLRIPRELEKISCRDIIVGTNLTSYRAGEITFEEMMTRCVVQLSRSRKELLDARVTRAMEERR